MSLLFSTTPHPSSQEEGTTGSWRADTGVCPYVWMFRDNKNIMGNPDLLRIAHCKGYSSVIILLYHDLELRSSSFTFGRTRTRSVLLSLNHDLLAILDVEAASGLRHLTTADVEDAVVGLSLVAYGLDARVNGFRNEVSVVNVDLVVDVEGELYGQQEVLRNIGACASIHLAVLEVEEVVAL